MECMARKKIFNVVWCSDSGLRICIAPWCLSQANHERRNSWNRPISTKNHQISIKFGTHL